MQALPFSLVPTVLVPVWLMMHGAIFVRLRRESGFRAVARKRAG